MLFSSKDIQNLLISDAMIREESRVKVVDGLPELGAEDTVYIYIDKYPTVADFEATWKIWVIDNSGMASYLLEAISSLLPKFEKRGEHYVTVEFASDKTVVKTEEQIEAEKSRGERKQFRKSFESLQENVEKRLELVRNGADGADGKDGLPGRDGKDGENGKDGKDLLATDAELFDLKDVEQSRLPLNKGQVLMYDGSGWTNLYVPQVTSMFNGGGGSGSSGGDGETVIIADEAPETREDSKPLQEGDQWWSSSEGRMHVYYVDGDSAQWVQSSGDGGTGIEDAPNNGQFYVRKYGEWVRLVDALAELGITAP